MKKRIFCILALFLVGCSQSIHYVEKENYVIERQFTEQQQTNNVKYLIIHYTALNDDDSYHVLTDGGVSIHYLIPTFPAQISGKPVVTQLVSEKDIAWHAGKSHWQNDSSLNQYSLGIEIVNKGFEQKYLRRQWLSYTDEQINLVERLALDIIQRYNIPPYRVLGHSDIAPLRKQDPGPLFPWQQLANLGIGAWPDEAVVEKKLAGRAAKSAGNIQLIQHNLRRYGYDIPTHGKLDKETRQVISAFQMHFRSDDFTGQPDAQTEALSSALVEKYFHINNK